MANDIELAFVMYAQDSRAPKHCPEEWISLFHELTGEMTHAWGVRAAQAILTYRRLNRAGPTFEELFGAMVELPEIGNNGAVLNQRKIRQKVYQFRHHIAVHWRRAGWINWDHRPRSLRTGRTFQAAAHAWARGGGESMVYSPRRA